MTKLANEIFLSENTTYIFGNEKHNTGLSDDIDSKGLCDLLYYVKGWRMNVFQSKTEKWVLDVNNPYDTVYLDLAVTQEKGIDNHLLMNTPTSKINPKLINFNNLLGINNLTNKKEKYSLSSLLMGYYLYDFPLPKEEEFKIQLLLIDGAYQGHFNVDFVDTHTNWLEMMNMTELIDVLNKYRESYFKIRHIMMKEMGDSIKYDKRKQKLETSILLDYKKLFNGLGFPLVPFPEEPMTLVERYSNRDFETNGYTPSVTNENIVSYAFTYANKGRYSIKK